MPEAETEQLPAGPSGLVLTERPRKKALTPVTGKWGGFVQNMSYPQAYSQRLEVLRNKDLREHWEERAAIMEYDGGLSRQEAEDKAVVEVLNVRRRALAGLHPAP